MRPPSYSSPPCDLRGLRELRFSAGDSVLVEWMGKEVSATVAFLVPTRGASRYWRVAIPGVKGSPVYNQDEMLPVTLSAAPLRCARCRAYTLELDERGDCVNRERCARSVAVVESLARLVRANRSTAPCSATD